MQLTNKPSIKFKPLPLNLYSPIILLLIIAGLLVSLYLSYSHFKIYTDIEYQSFCAISQTINCETVSQSKYAVFLNVPIASWGVLGYVLLLTIFLISIQIIKKRIRLLTSQFLILLLFSCISLYLGIVSSLLIDAYCIMCIASWVINFSLLFLFWLIRQRIETLSLMSSFKKDFHLLKKNKTCAVTLIIIFSLLAGSLIMYYPKYWNLQPPHNSTQISTGITENGHPWIGAENPQVTIIEFSDYLCFQCKKMHFFLRNFVAKYPDKLRLVHRHFPMDHKFNPIVKKPFHSGAGILSLIAISSIEKNNFWDTNDYLFNYEVKNSAIWLRQIAKDLDIDLKELQQRINKKANRIKLSKDIIFGIKKKIDGTPTYIINGHVYIGHIPKKIIQSLDKQI
jgi:protein-disulfide isomerase/uncharacterized membrane protein